MTTAPQIAHAAASLVAHTTIFLITTYLKALDGRIAGATQTPIQKIFLPKAIPECHITRTLWMVSLATVIVYLVPTGCVVLISSRLAALIGSILRYPDASVAASFPGGLTLETDAIMSGNPQNMLSFADLMDGASVPYSPQQGTIRGGSTSSRLSGSNSVDSINAIDQPTSGPSTTPLRPVDGPTEDVVEEIWSGQHRPDTSKRETLFQKGRVKHVVESIISRTETETKTNARPTLSPFLKLQPFKSSHPAFKVYPGQSIQAWGNLQSQE